MDGEDPWPDESRTRGATSHSVEVRFGPDGGPVALVDAVAARFGVEIVLLGGKGHGSLIGDCELPPSPPQWHVEAAFLRALAPRHMLFLCVANSARSQLAEGLARALAPEGVRISSAGSAPTSVRPQAVAVLAEIGIDISHHTSGGIDDVGQAVDTVVTLCSEEVCPVWLGYARRLHWGLPDPAAVEGTKEQMMDAFRSVRDELRTRLGIVFQGRELQ